MKKQHKAWDPFGELATDTARAPGPDPGGADLDSLLTLQAAALAHGRELAALRGLVEVQSELLEEARLGLALLADAVLISLADLDPEKARAAWPFLPEGWLGDATKEGWTHVSPVTGGLVDMDDIPGFDPAKLDARRPLGPLTWGAEPFTCPGCGAVPKGHPSDGPCPACGWVQEDEGEE